MRVAISTAYFGGAGGVERAVYSVAAALVGSEVVIFAATRLGGELMEMPPHVSVAAPWQHRPLVGGKRWPARAVNRVARAVQRWRNRPFDLLLHYGAEVSARPYVRSRRSAVVAAGAELSRLNSLFDVLILEAPIQDVPERWERRVHVVPPPVFPIAELGELPPDVTEPFLLTVMNPYGQVKGADILSEVAPRLDVEVVWCLSDHTVNIDFATLEVPANVRLIVNPSQATLRALYEACHAYVSFSRSEGFGWAIADALQYGAPVIARPVGVLTVPDVDMNGVHFYDDPDDIVEMVRQLPCTRVTRDLGVLSAGSFVSSIERLVDAP